jgi:PAS domain S-box-containing protein
MRHTAKAAALVLSMPEIARLTGTRADLGAADRAAVMARLADTRKAIPRIHSIQVFRVGQEGRELVCLAGSGMEEPPETSGASARLMPGPADVRRILLDDAVVLGPPSRAASGAWVTACARIDDGSRGHLARVDLPRDGWPVSAPGTGVRWALCAWLLLGIPFAVCLLARRNSRQSRFIEQLCAAVEQSAAGIVIMDEKGIIRYVNNSLCKLSKFDREDLIGSHWAARIGGMAPDTLDLIVRSSAEGKSWIEDFECERKDGGKYIGHAISTPVRDAAGEIIARITVVTDMTALARQAGRLREAKERAEAADKAKGVFLATMSHEVRTPLNGIVGFTDLLGGTDLTDEQREYVRVIRASGELLLRLTGSILDFTRLEQGIMRMEPEPVDLRALVKEALDNVAPRAARKKLRLLRSVAPSVPQWVRCDPARVRQVLMHLADNAVKFTPAGEVEVSVRARARPPSAAEGRDETGAPLQLEFMVRDTGIGIAPEDRLRLFRPFEQLDSSCARRYEGSGLGLVISYDLVRLMGGGLSVISEKNKGSTFSFTIPCDETSPPRA